MSISFHCPVVCAHVDGLDGAFGQFPDRMLLAARCRRRRGSTMPVLRCAPCWCATPEFHIPTGRPARCRAQHEGTAQRKVARVLCGHSASMLRSLFLVGMRSYEALRTVTTLLSEHRLFCGPRLDPFADLHWLFRRGRPGQAAFSHRRQPVFSRSECGAIAVDPDVLVPGPGRVA